MSKSRKDSGSFRNYGFVEAFLSPRKRALLRRALSEFNERITKNPDRYKRKYNLNDKTVRTHRSDLNSLMSDFNLS